MTNKLYVTKTKKFDTSPSELDFENRDQFGFDDDAHEEFVEITNGVSTDIEPILIDSLIEILAKAKAAGSTHIAIDYHCDHIGYDIEGYEIRLSTQDEISFHEDRLAADRAKRLEIHNLQAQIAKLRNS